MRILLIGLFVCCALGITGQTSNNIFAPLDKIANKETIPSISTDATGTSNIQQALEVTMHHIVSAGETLPKIARTHDVTVADIREWNNMVSSNIKTGQRLIIHKIEYIAVEDYIKKQLKEPELLAVRDNPNSATDIMCIYIRDTEREIEFQRSKNDEKVYHNLLSSANDTRLEKEPTTKKSNILTRMANSLTSAFGNIKNPAKSANEQSKKSKLHKEFLADNTNAMDTISNKALPSEHKTQEYEPLIKAEKDIYTFTIDIASSDDNLIKLYHKVKIGETITQIASRYRVSKEDIILWNKLTSNIVKIRQRLLIFMPKDNSLTVNDRTSVVLNQEAYSISH